MKDNTIKMLSKQEISIETNKTKRIEWLDIARSIAIVMVVLCHAVESTCVLSDANWDSTTIIYRLFRIVGFTLGRLGVPFFLFLSGYLVLNKPIETYEQIKSFYKRKFGGLLLTVEIWNVIYYFFMMIHFEREWDTLSFIKQLLFLENSGLSHMWYMPMILGIYLAMPFLTFLVNKFSFKEIAFPLSIAGFISFVLPSLNIVLKIVAPEIESLNSILYMDYMGGVYGVYVILGYYVYRKELLKKVNTYVIAAVSFITFLAMVYMQYWTYAEGSGYNIWYNNIILLIFSLCLFELLMRSKNIQWNKSIVKVTATISKISLGIYFLHKPIQFILLRVDIFKNINKIILSIIIFILSSILSIAISVIITKSKILKKLLMFM